MNVNLIQEDITTDYRLLSNVGHLDIGTYLYVPILLHSASTEEGSASTTGSVPSSSRRACAAP